MDRTKMTVVFSVEDAAAMEPFYEAFRKRATLFGMKPTSISWGDQVHVPSDVVCGLADLDPQFPDKQELTSLIELAKSHLKT